MSTRPCQEKRNSAPLPAGSTATPATSSPSCSCSKGAARTRLPSFSTTVSPSPSSNRRVVIHDRWKALPDPTQRAVLKATCTLRVLSAAARQPSVPLSDSPTTRHW